MGHLHTQVTVSGEKTAVVRMLVDTGSTYSVIPKALARTIGLTRLRPLMMTLADGRRRKLGAGTVVCRIGHREAPTTVLIADIAEPVLGVTTLDELGLAVDPRRGRLTPTRPYTVRLTGFR